MEAALIPLWIKIASVPACIIVAIRLFHLLMLWMESRDWIYYKRKRPSRSSSRAVLGAFQEFVQPEIRHVQEDRRQRYVEKSSNEGADG